MFIGHFAVAFAGKTVARKPNLGWLFAACQWPDLLWPILCLVGMEHFRIEPGNTAFTPLAFDYYPWSHSLLMDLVWGAVLGLIYLARRGDKRGALVIGALVVSHWVLDCITHRPDMPLTPSNDHRFGLGLWNHVVLTIALESALFLAAVWIYDRVTTPKDRIGRIGFWVLAVGLAGIYVANIMSPPPPSPTAVAWTALGMWILIPIAGWIDRHRAMRAETATPHTNQTN
jgi:LexA-binding, inner membrane-associated putative hydrolase